MDVTQLVLLLAALTTVLDGLPRVLGALKRAFLALRALLRTWREGGGRNKKG